MRNEGLLGIAGAGLTLLLAGASLGEGGAAPDALLAIHLAIGALVILAALDTRGAGRAPEALPCLALAGVIAVAAIGATRAPYGFAAWLVLVEQLAFFGVAWVAARRGPELLARLAPLLLVAAGLQGALVVVQRVYLRQDRPPGTFLNTNHLGAWIVAALVLGLGSWPEGAPRLLRLARIPAVVLAAAGLALTGSRGALLGLGAAVVCFTVATARRAGAITRRRVLAAGVLVLALAAAAGLATRLRAADPFLYGRARIWRASLGAFAAAPWTGTGPGQFAAAAANLNFPLDEAPVRFERSFTSPHSDLLRAPCELGVPGAALVLLALGAAARSIARRIARGQLPPGAAAAAAALAGLVAQASVDDLTERPALYLLFAALTGCLLSRERSAEARASVPVRTAAVFLLVLVLAVGEVAPWLAWQAQHALPRGRLDAAQRHRLDAAIAHNRSQPDLWLRRAEDLAGSGADWSAAIYARARDAAERAVRLQPADARYRLGLARIEALACLTLFADVGTRARASAEYARAQELARHDPFVALEQGKFLIASGDPEGARRAAERALSIEPHAVPGRLLLAESIAVGPEAAAKDRARAILRDAEETALRFRDVPKETAYARTLLTIDEPWRRTLVARLQVDSVPVTP